MMFSKYYFGGKPVLNNAGLIASNRFARTTVIDLKRKAFEFFRFHNYTDDCTQQFEAVGLLRLRSSLFDGVSADLVPKLLQMLRPAKGRSFLRIVSR